MAEPITNPESGKDAASDSNSELLILSPQRETLRFGDRDVEVGPLKIRQLGLFCAALRDLMPYIVGSLKGNGSLNFQLLMSEGHEQLIEAVAIGAGTDKEFVAQLELDDFILLAGKVLVVNVDFFVQRLPDVNALVARSMAKLLPEPPAQGGEATSAGDASSNASSNTGTTAST